MSCTHKENGHIQNGHPPNSQAPSNRTPNGLALNGHSPNGHPPNGYAPNGLTSENISFASITPENVEILKKLNSELFPIKYGDIFYNGVQQPELAPYCKLVYVNDEPVGTITGRVVDHENEMKLYIMTMGVLEPHRSKKIGTKILQYIVDVARETENPKLASIILHVWLRNEDAKRFYERNGFLEAGIAVEFYKADIDVRDAWLLELRFLPRLTNGVNGVGKHHDASSPSDK